MKLKKNDNIKGSSVNDWLFLFVTSYPIGEEVKPDRGSQNGETLLDLLQSCYFAALQNLKSEPNKSDLKIKTENILS